MNTFHKVILIIGSFVLFSCDTDIEEFQANYKIINNSDHDIILTSFNDSLQDEQIDLAINETVCQSIDGDETLFINILSIEMGDSIVISYSDSVTVTHPITSDSTNLKRLFPDRDNWELKDTYSYEYVFTNDDYDEALELMTEE